MTDRPLLIDRPALDRRRARAQRHGLDLFLHQQVVDEVQERLIEVNRSFTAPAIVAGFKSPWQDLGGALADATLVEDADLLALEPQAHDLVIHSLCLHAANDPVGQIIQCRRALKPDGLFIAVLLGGNTLHELRAALAEAETRLTGGLSPRVVPMGDIRDLGALLQRAGLALPVADSHVQTLLYSDLSRLYADLRAMGETNALTQRHRRFASRALFEQTARIYAQSFGRDTGQLPATVETVYLTGWAPDATQQQPLRPGSAATRLADALNTDEAPLPDKAGRDGTHNKT